VKLELGELEFGLELELEKGEVGAWTGKKGGG
jgi:hypothetical protein